MKSSHIFLLSGVFLLAVITAVAQQVPFLQKKGNATQLMVDNRPLLMLAGETGNSVASSLNDLQAAFGKAKKMNLNTLLVPVYWELLEPEEGKFDFTLVDGIIDLAQRTKLKVVLLWFGAWKNSMSCYAPLWVKEDSRKYPRAETKDGRRLEILSAFSAANLEVDKKAFSALMLHLAKADKQRTVVMVQVENEIGMLTDARDHSSEANALFHAQVPVVLMDYLEQHKEKLQPKLFEQWKANGYKTQGNWPEIFGEGLATDELFMAWHYGLFIQALAQAGKAAYPLPMYLNAALDSRGRKPGEYPSAGPLAHLLDIWRAAAPAIDFLSPDIYDPGFEDWIARYHTNGNPLFIPEIRLHEANAVRVFYAFGEHDAMGFSPFSIESVENPENYPLTKSYALLQQLSPLLASLQGQGRSRGLLFNGLHKERKIEFNNYTFTCRHDYTLGWSPEIPDNDSLWPETGALILELSPNEYIVAGSGVVITFEKTNNKNFTAGIASIDEVEFNNEKMIVLRRLNGDQSHQGRHLRIPAGKWNLQYLKLYGY